LANDCTLELYDLFAVFMKHDTCMLCTECVISAHARYTSALVTT